MQPRARAITLALAVCIFQKSKRDSHASSCEAELNSASYLLFLNSVFYSLQITIHLVLNQFLYNIDIR